MKILHVTINTLGARRTSIDLMEVTGAKRYDDASYFCDESEDIALFYSGEGVVKICFFTEKLLRQALSLVELVAIVDKYCLKLALKALQEFGSKTLFPFLEDHMFDTEAESNHVHCVIKATMAGYLKIRLNHESKRMMERMTKDTIRNKLARLVLHLEQDVRFLIDLYLILVWSSSVYPSTWLPALMYPVPLNSTIVTLEGIPALLTYIPRQYTVSWLSAIPDSSPRDVRCAPLSPESLQVSWQPPPETLVHGVIQGYRLLYEPVPATEQHVTLGARDMGGSRGLVPCHRANHEFF
ncbi:unnamed protein product [Timema podura]|uniref:Fibronectin type-III domain-containing protein n=1 Tax=Timema podura TaxID=61482 RepID=A0ABN7NEU0_TIMPD|nr:unnamed protein product [Timema podura]